MCQNILSYMFVNGFLIVCRLVTKLMVECSLNSQELHWVQRKHGEKLVSFHKRLENILDPCFIQTDLVSHFFARIHNIIISYIRPYEDFLNVSKILCTGQQAIQLLRITQNRIQLLTNLHFNNHSSELYNVKTSSQLFSTQQRKNQVIYKLGQLLHYPLIYPHDGLYTK